MQKQESLPPKSELERWLAQKIQDGSRELLRFIDVLQAVRMMPETHEEQGRDA